MNIFNDLNNVRNINLIKITSCWDFTYLEENLDIDSPVRSYFFKYNDLSINLVLTLKWSLYGYYFFKSIKETLDNPIYFDDIIFNSDIIWNSDFIKLFYIDDFIINDFNDFKSIFEGEYSEPFYTENSVVRFKLRLNSKEFILLNTALFPRLVEFEK